MQCESDEDLVKADDDGEQGPNDCDTSQSSAKQKD